MTNQEIAAQVLELVGGAKNVKKRIPLRHTSSLYPECR